MLFILYHLYILYEEYLITCLEIVILKKFTNFQKINHNNISHYCVGVFLNNVNLYLIKLFPSKRPTNIKFQTFVNI